MLKVNRKLIGPFRQILTLNHLSATGPLYDRQLEIIPNGGVIIEDNKIISVDSFAVLKKAHHFDKGDLEYQEKDSVLLPGLIDSHTHLCYAGSRANDFANRIAGKSYLEIANEGGGIWQTVEATRKSTAKKLSDLLVKRVQQKLNQGVTTIEIKSGYGLDIPSEIKQLQIINKVSKNLSFDLISTCLAAHVRPRDFNGSNKDYLEFIVNELFPVIKSKQLTNRIDIFVEEGAFNKEEARKYLGEAQKNKFDITMHADQFTCTGSELAAELKILSADHLEASSIHNIELLKKNGVICTALPGASLGLGQNFAPARKILDVGASLVIASDQNPGSAPHGDLLAQASILASYEKLYTAEVFAALTFRAARALNLYDRGIIAREYTADMVAYPTADYREILYQQGNLKPSAVWVKGVKHYFG